MYSLLILGYIQQTITSSMVEHLSINRRWEFEPPVGDEIFSLSYPDDFRKLSANKFDWFDSSTCSCSTYASMVGQTLPVVLVLDF